MDEDVPLSEVMQLDRSLTRHLVRTRPLSVQYVWSGLRAIAAFALAIKDDASEAK